MIRRIRVERVGRVCYDKKQIKLRKIRRQEELLWKDREN